MWNAAAFVMVKVTLPAAMVPCDSSTFHSESLADTAPGGRSAERQNCEQERCDVPR